MACLIARCSFRQSILPLGKEKETDEKLTQLAGSINLEAAECEKAAAGRQPAPRQFFE
jgi:hypothetical protein